MFYSILSFRNVFKIIGHNIINCTMNNNNNNNHGWSMLVVDCCGHFNIFFIVTSVSYEVFEAI